jgi:hypothetical protein
MRLRPTIAVLSILAVVAIGVGVLAVRRSGAESVAIKSSATPSRKAAQLHASRSAIARITGAQARANAVARAGRTQYRKEIGGFVQRQTARGVARNTALVAAVQAGRLGVARSLATSLLYRANHISHIEIVKGGKSIVRVGKDFVVGAKPIALRGGATLDVSIQDVIGFVRLLHRRTGAQVIVHGRGARVSSSLPAADNMSLPAKGAVTVAGHRYHASSFATTGLLGEPLSVWVLTRG